MGQCGQQWQQRVKREGMGQHEQQWQQRVKREGMGQHEQQWQQRVKREGIGQHEQQWQQRVKREQRNLNPAWLQTTVKDLLFRCFHRMLWLVYGFCNAFISISDTWAWFAYVRSYTSIKGQDRWRQFVWMIDVRPGIWGSLRHVGSVFRSATLKFCCCCFLLWLAYNRSSVRLSFKEGVCSENINPFFAVLLK